MTHRTDGSLLAYALESMASAGVSLEHPLRVMVAMGPEDLKVVAVLHEHLRVLPATVTRSIPERLLMAARTLEHGRTDDASAQAVLVDPLALPVKLACIADTADPHNLAMLDRFTARRQLSDCAEMARALGTDLATVRSLWNGGASPYHG